MIFMYVYVFVLPAVSVKDGREGGGGCFTVRRNSAPTNVSSHGIEDTVSRFFFRIGKGYDGLMARVEGWAPCGSCNGRERERERGARFVGVRMGCFSYFPSCCGNRRRWRWGL